MSSGLSDLVLRWRGAPARVLELLKPDLILDEGEEVPPNSGRVIKDGLWPGIRRSSKVGEKEYEAASASAEPWVDANGYLIEFHRALVPGSSVWLAQRAPNREDLFVPFGSVELALVEARFAGGNFILDFPARWRQLLEHGNEKAFTDLARLAATASWLKQWQSCFGLPSLPIITAWVEPSPACREIANLLHRRGACPLLQSTTNRAIPPGAAVVVAAGLKQVPLEALDAVRRGAILVIDQALPMDLRKIKQEPDREIFEWVGGRVVRYQRKIQDPSEFALDVIDLAGHKRRAARLWNAPAVLYMATHGQRPGEAILRIINYGEDVRGDIQARIQGHYSRALLSQSGHPEQALPVAKRGSMSEVFVPRLQRAAIVQFSS